MSKKENGSALFLILIAVALFAALSYAVTKSGGSVSGAISKEEAVIEATKILETSEYISSSLQRFMLIENLNIWDVSFDNDVYKWDYENIPPYPTTQHLFHPDGAGLDWPDLPKGTVKWYIVGSTDVIGFGKNTGCTDSTPCSELTLILEGVPLDVCMELNKMGGVTNTGGKPPVDNGDFETVPYKGSRTNFKSGIHKFDATNQENYGKRFACLETLAGYRGGLENISIITL